MSHFTQIGCRFHSFFLGRPGRTHGSFLRLQSAFVLLIAIGALLTACGDETAPDVESMTLREALGMETERFGELKPSERDAVRRKAVSEWSAAVTRPPSPADIDVEPQRVSPDTGLTSPLAFVDAYDVERAAAGEDILVSARVEANVGAPTAQVRATPIPLELLGFRLEDGGMVEGLSTDESVFDGQLRWDEDWGRVELSLLHGASELEAVQSLEPVFRRYLYQMGLTVETAQVVSAPQAPILMWYDREHRAVLLNPNLLYMLTEDAMSANRALSGPSSAPVASSVSFLAPEFIEQCVNEQQLRCSRCFGTSARPNPEICSPLLGDGSPGIAEQECDWMAQDKGRGFYLYCYNRAAANNYACIATQDPKNICGAAGAPYDTLGTLERLSPMLEPGSFCESVARDCHESRVTDAEIPEPPDVDSDPVDDDDDDDFCGDIWSLGCDIGSGCGSTDGGGGGDCGGDTGGGGCGGDTGGGLCNQDDDDDDDESAEASIVKPGTAGRMGLILGLPLLILLGVALRRNEHTSCGKCGY